MGEYDQGLVRRGQHLRSHGDLRAQSDIATGPLGEDTEVNGFLLAEDPDLGTIETPYGRLCLLLMVGVTAENLEAEKGGNAAGVLESLRGTGWVTRA